MKNVSRIMKEYFDKPPMKKSNILLETFSADVPVVPAVMTWKVVTDPERLMKRFEFSNRNELIDFLAEIFEFENETDHHGKITIDELHIDVEVYTKTVDCITELDLEYTKTLDQILEDVKHYAYPG